MTKDSRKPVKGHPVVSRKEWLSARTAFLAKEKKFTRLRDDLSRQRRELPWVSVDKQYVFDGPSGKETLAELLQNRSQLIVYHFMFSPDDDEGCLHCSFWADNFNGNDVHLNHRDVTFVAISRAPLAKIRAFKKRMGWGFKWVSSFHNDFNFDFRASFSRMRWRAEKPSSASVPRAPACRIVRAPACFTKTGGARCFTRTRASRGHRHAQRRLPLHRPGTKGRDEDGLEGTQDWVRHHDRYED